MYSLRENWAAVGEFWDRVNLSDFQMLPYRPHALVAVIPKGHALEGTPKIKFTDLYRHDVAGHRSSLEAEHALRRSKVIPEQPLKYKAISGWPEKSLRLVRAGLGLAVLPDDVTKPYVETFNLVTVKINERFAHQINVLRWR